MGLRLTLNSMSANQPGLAKRMYFPKHTLNKIMQGQYWQGNQ